MSNKLCNTSLSSIQRFKTHIEKLIHNAEKTAHINHNESPLTHSFPKTTLKTHTNFSRSSKSRMNSNISIKNSTTLSNIIHPMHRKTISSMQNAIKSRRNTKPQSRCISEFIQSPKEKQTITTKELDAFDFNIQAERISSKPSEEPEKAENTRDLEENVIAYEKIIRSLSNKIVNLQESQNVDFTQYKNLLDSQKCIKDKCAALKAKSSMVFQQICSLKSYCQAQLTQHLNICSKLYISVSSLEKELNLLNEIAEISKDTNAMPIESISFDTDLKRVKASLLNATPYKIHRRKKLIKASAKEMSDSIPTQAKKGNDNSISKLNNST